MKHLLFVLALVALFLGTSAYAQNSAPFTYTIASTDIALTVGEGAFEASELVPGTCYDIPADPLGANIIDPRLGAEEVAFTAVEIAGAPGADIYVQFGLQYAIGNEFGVLTLSYDNLSAAWTMDEAMYFWFNPEQGLYANLGAGTVLIYLGADVCVPPTGNAGTWEGLGVVMANYISTP